MFENFIQILGSVKDMVITGIYYVRKKKHIVLWRNSKV